MNTRFDQRTYAQISYKSLHDTLIPENSGCQTGFFVGNTCLVNQTRIKLLRSGQFSQHATQIQKRTNFA